VHIGIPLPIILNGYRTAVGTTNRKWSRNLGERENQTQRQARNASTDDARQIGRASRMARDCAFPRHARLHSPSLEERRNASSAAHGRNVVANPEELNHWLQRTSREAAGVHVVTPGSDLLKDPRASVAAQKGVTKSPPKQGSVRAKRDVKTPPKRKRAHGCDR
jgi:hypothetical protein